MTSIILAGIVLFNSTTSAPAQAAYSRTFNGTNQYATYATQPITAFPVTLCAWFKMTAADQVPIQQSIIVALDNPVNGNYQLAIEWGAVDPATGTNVNKVFAATKQTSTNRVPSDSTVTADAWHHVCAVFDAHPTITTSNDDRVVYLDADPGAATSDSTITRAVFSGSTPPTQFHVGVKSNSGETLQSYFKGTVAHVAIWNSILTAAEIADLAGAANGGTNGTANNPLNALYTANLVAYYPFAYNSGEDSYGPYDLTFTNSPSQGTDVPTIEAAP